MSRLNWSNNRQSPTDEDDITPSEPSYEFDYRRCGEPGKPSWPERHGRERFGPALIGKAWKAGLVVVAEIEGYPRPVAVAECKWGINGTLLVKTLEGWIVPQRLWTRTNAKGLTSTGLLMED